MKMILSPFYCALTEVVQSPIKLVKSGNSIKEIPVAHEGLACGLDAISALHNYACSIAIGVVSFSYLELSGLSQGLLQSVPSLQVSVAMPYYSTVMVSIGFISGS